MKAPLLDRLEDGPVSEQMRCPQCFAYGSNHYETVRRPWAPDEPYEILVYARPRPDCSYCGGQGFVTVEVEMVSAPFIEVPMFAMAG